MMSATNYWEGQILNDLSTCYVALFTAAPGEAGGGTEVSGGAYTRVSANCSSGSNAAAVTFPTATANWGTITHFALFDAVTAGNMLAYGSVGTSKAVNTDDTAEFGAGSITVSVD